MKKATNKAATPKPLAAKTSPAVRAPASPAPEPKKAATPVPSAIRVSKTLVTAHCDVGFGNQLFIRGEGPGLSWDQGVLMECVSSDMWTWSSSAVSRPFAYKVLINDEQWSAGDDFVASVGVGNSISPGF